MPIYGDKLTGTQYKIVTQIELKEYKKLMELFKESTLTFPYSNDINFIKTIELDENYGKIRYIDKYPQIYDLKWFNQLKDKIPFIASFKTNNFISDYKYGIMMESLIKEANINLGNSSKYMFDITGSWIDGKVILLKKK